MKNLFTNGEVSINKLARVTSVVTQENEEFWANQVQLLPQKALEVLVRDERSYQKEECNSGRAFGNSNGFRETFFEGRELHAQLKNQKKLESDENKNGLQDELFDNESLRAQISMQQKVSESNLATIENLEKLQLTNKITKRLLGFKQKGFDLNQLLEELLNKREAEIEDEKEEIAQAMELEQSSTGASVSVRTLMSTRTNVDEPTLAPLNHFQTSRYIPLKIRRLVTKEHGNKCSIPTCHKPSETLHHSQRFALAHFHDPRYLAPLCKEHHLIAHSIDLKFHEKRKAVVIL